jgi:hypothetical protein
MVFDLKVCASEHNIHQATATNVSRRDDLPDKEVRDRLSDDYGHPLVVRRERPRKIQPEYALMYRREQYGFWPAERDQERHVADEMHCEEHHFDGSTLWSCE